MRSLLAIALISSLAACSTTNPDVISRRDAQQLSTVQDATVISVRNVTVDGTQSGAGAVTGGVIGGIAGSSVGGSREQAVVGVLGAVVGAVAGNAIERASTKEEAVELLLQLRNGERRAIIQARGSDQFNIGDPVIIVTSGHKVRVARAPVVQAPTQAPANSGR